MILTHQNHKKYNIHSIFFQIKYTIKINLKTKATELTLPIPGIKGKWFSQVEPNIFAGVVKQPIEKTKKKAQRYDSVQVRLQ